MFHKALPEKKGISWRRTQRGYGTSGGVEKDLQPKWEKQLTRQLFVVLSTNPAFMEDSNKKSCLFQTM